MKERIRRLRAPSLYLFREAWKGHTDVKRRLSDAEAWRPNAEAWRRNGETLRQTWEMYMHAILSPAAWLSLSLLLERRHDLRWLWIKPGGYFFTKAGNRRKVIREKLRPRGITVNLRDRLTDAERIYHEALESEVFGPNAIMVMTLALAGFITSDRFSADVAHVRREQMRQRRKRWRLWPPSRTSSLRYLKHIGFLQQPDDDRLLL